MAISLKKKKFCWVAKEYKKGWRLGFGIGQKPPKYLDVWFKTEEDIDAAVYNSGIVYVCLSDSKSKLAES